MFTLEQRFNAAYSEYLNGGGYDIIKAAFTVNERIRFKKRLNAPFDKEEAEFITHTTVKMGPSCAESAE